VSAAVVLVTSMSGTGKSTALVQLGRRGHRVIDTRIGDRANPFGSRSERRAKIARDLVEFESLLRAGVDHEIVTTVPVGEGRA